MTSLLIPVPFFFITLLPPSNVRSTKPRQEHVCTHMYTFYIPAILKWNTVIWCIRLSFFVAYISIRPATFPLGLFQILNTQIYTHNPETEICYYKFLGCCTTLLFALERVSIYIHASLIFSPTGCWRYALANNNGTVSIIPLFSHNLNMCFFFPLSFRMSTNFAMDTPIPDLSCYHKSCW